MKIMIASELIEYIERMIADVGDVAVVANCSPIINVDYDYIDNVITLES